MSKGKGRGRGRGAPNDPARRERASRSGVQGVVQEAATAEVLEAGAAADSAPGKLPALGKEELPRLVERFEHLGFPFPRGIDKFKPEDARLAFNAHLEKWGLSKRDTPHARGPIQPRVYVSRPPLEGCTHWLDLSDAMLRALLQMPLAERAGALPIYSSATAVVNSQAEARGYSPQPLVYLETDAALPPPVSNAEMPDAEDDEEEEESARSAPARLLLPDTLPPLPSGKPAAAQIVEMFESFVHVDGVGTFSPLRLWTLAERQKKGDKMSSQTTNFGRRAHIYLYIISRGEDPAGMPEKESALREQMMAWKKEMGAAEAKKIDFDAAVKVANERIAAAGLMAMPEN